MAFTTMRVLEDAHEKDLCFATEGDAAEFREFVEEYMETLEGNGYTIYWIFDPKTSFCLTKPTTGTRLNVDALWRMVTALQNILCFTRYILEIGSHDGAIHFKFDHN